MKKIISYCFAVLNFLKKDIWLVPLHGLSPVKAFLVGQIRVVLLAFKGFDEDKCYFRASALTFYTLLSIVPVFAMLFGIARGFGLEDRLDSNIRKTLYGHEEISNRIIEFSRGLLDNANGGLIAGIGVLVLFWSVIKLLGNIEHSFNDIWGIKNARTLSRKLSDYLAILLICPVFLVASSSVTVLLGSQVQTIANKIHILNNPVVFWTLSLAPYVTMAIFFNILYMFLPNTKVKLVAGIVAGVVAGTLFNLSQYAYVTFQIFTSKYNAIYGSFAALPLFLAWLQLSWVIVLFGAEVSFAVQNVETYEHEPESLNVNYSLKRLLVLLISKICVDKFYNGESPLTAVKIADLTDLPIRLVRQILFELVDVGVLCEVRTKDENEYAYQPARNVEILTVHYVLSKLGEFGVDNVPVLKNKEYDRLSSQLKKFDEILEKSPANAQLKMI